jgi:hypothetical protein
MEKREGGSEGKRENWQYCPFVRYSFKRKKETNRILHFVHPATNYWWLFPKRI